MQFASFRKNIGFLLQCTFQDSNTAKLQKGYIFLSVLSKAVFSSFAKVYTKNKLLKISHTLREEVYPLCMAESYRKSPKIYQTIILGLYFGKLYPICLDKII